MFQFKNKIAIVTGGASGIGHALCKQLAGFGAIVILVDIAKEEGEEVALSLRKIGYQVFAVHADVTQPAQVQWAVEEVVRKYGRIDYIFNNAGLSVIGEVQDLTVELWQKIINVNLMGVIHGSTYAYQHMIKQKSGHIVNIASLAGLVPFPTTAAYATTKHAVVGFSSSLRAEALEYDVYVTTVCPGYVDTKIFDRACTVSVKPHVLMRGLPVALMRADTAAKLILSAVVKREETVIFPFYAYVLWLLYRLYPGILNPLLRMTVRKFQEAKIDR